jgi:hypothetical protein
MSDHCKNLELRSTIRKELEEAHARSRNAFDHPEITELRKAVHSDDYTVVEKRLMEKYRELEGETLEAISERWAHAHPDLYRVKGYVVQCAITHLPLFVGDLVTKAELMDEDGELRSMLFLSAACILGPHQGEYLELAQDATADELTP